MPIDFGRFEELKPVKVSGLRWDKERKEALFVVVTPRGKSRTRIVKVLPFASVKAAKNAFFKFKAQVQAGDPAEASASTDAVQPRSDASASTSFADYVTEYWESLHSACVGSTQDTNRRSYERYVKPFFGSKPVGEIAESDCEDFVATMKERSPYTTNLALRFVRKVLHHARRRKLRTDVPEDFHFVKEHMLKLELSDEEQDRFFAAFDDRGGFIADLRKRRKKGKVVRSARFGFKERYFGGSRRDDSEAADVYFERFRRSRLLFTAAVDLGYRVTDLRLLKRSAVDLKKGLVTIITRKTGKGAAVALSDRCRDAIEEAMSSAVANAEYVFTTEEGQPYSETTVRRYFALAKKLAGITRRCRINDLRHTFASNLASEGLSLLDIRDALGHTTVRMSERYAKPNERALERMREALNARQQRSGATRGYPDAQNSKQ